MRPSDENQDNRMHPHLRPNLMSSSRRGGHEDSILAKLERAPARRGAAGNGARLAWYGMAAVLALGLTATLAWLAKGAVPAPLEMARTEAVPPAAASAPPAHAPAATALIVDAAPASALAPQAAPEPVLAPPAPAPVPALRLLEPAATRPAPARLAPAQVKAPPPRRPEPRAGADARLRASAAQGRAGAAPRQSSRPPRTVDPARPGAAQDDSDVALISAVISHANGHAGPGEGEAPVACADGPCRTRPAR